MSDQEFDVRIGRLEARVEALGTAVEMLSTALETLGRRIDVLERRMDEGFRELRRQIFWLGSIQITSLLAMLALIAKIGHLF
ncbi:hypothetical protein [Pseudoduganella violacea]|uniref:Uncharacterized protein Yka (UPF0111/DUF47 family) n=1 Tax=Pseudoduganella violacea TaxID=1715466 RepID=A0A7W5B891_9BURK|nr:hypothetical protein [Pseudoduganella violacea]MBB3118344.1 uncharacterized protein Yka (UPF0111/DUF47 family) [Pseudoduganella violacea]